MPSSSRDRNQVACLVQCLGGYKSVCIQLIVNINHLVDQSIHKVKHILDSEELNENMSSILIVVVVEPLNAYLWYV